MSQSLHLGFVLFKISDQTDLLEFATAPHTRALTSLKNSLSSLEFTHTRSKAAFLGCHTFTVELSETLSPPWTYADPGTIIADGELQTLVTAIPTLPPPSHHPPTTLPPGARFVRLKVTAPKIACGQSRPRMYFLSA